MSRQKRSGSGKRSGRRCIGQEFDPHGDLGRYRVFVAATELAHAPLGSESARGQAISAAPNTTGAGLAVTLELLPERIDLVGFVLQLAGLGSLVALVLAVLLGEDDALCGQ